MWADTILIVFISVCTALLGEGKKQQYIHKCIYKNFVSFIYLFQYIYFICTFFLGLTWLMVYRTEKYQKLKAEVEKQSKKCKSTRFVIFRN